MLRSVLEPAEAYPAGTAFLSPGKVPESGALDLAALPQYWLECCSLGSSSGWGLSSVLRGSHPYHPLLGSRGFSCKIVWMSRRASK